MNITCREDQSLPDRTLCTSYQTARELKSCFQHRSFDILFDHALDDDVVLVSSDLHGQLSTFLAAEDQLQSPTP